MDPVKIQIMKRDSQPKEYTVDIEKELAHSKPQERFFFYSTLLGETIALQTLLDAEYRQARSVSGMKHLNLDPKISEWKAKAAFEATPEFRKYKDGEAAIQRNIFVLSGVLDSLYWGKTAGKVQRALANAVIRNDRN